jgi:hypothetical protein
MRVPFLSIVHMVALYHILTLSCDMVHMKEERVSVSDGLQMLMTDHYRLGWNPSPSDNALVRAIRRSWFDSVVNDTRQW